MIHIRTFMIGDLMLGELCFQGDALQILWHLNAVAADMLQMVIHMDDRLVVVVLLESSFPSDTQSDATDNGEDQKQYKNQRCHPDHGLLNALPGLVCSLSKGILRLGFGCGGRRRCGGCGGCFSRRCRRLISLNLFNDGISI